MLYEVITLAPGVQADVIGDQLPAVGVKQLVRPPLQHQPMAIQVGGDGVAQQQKLHLIQIPLPQAVVMDMVV